MQQLRTDLSDRQAIADYLLEEFDFLEDPGILSPHEGGRSKGLQRLEQFPVEKYAKQRNFLDGTVSVLSPYISRGCLELEEVRQWALNRSKYNALEKFISELAWRAFFRQIYLEEGDRILQDIEQPKVSMREHLMTLPDDIANAETNVPSMDTLIQLLKDEGYLHNHARLYLASYIVHFRKVSWRVGADWMYSLLIDGDMGSNHLSWQWVASTFSNKPYIFNRENLDRYGGSVLPGDPRRDDPFNYSYEELEERLFGGSFVSQPARSTGKYR